MGNKQNIPLNCSNVFCCKDDVQYKMINGKVVKLRKNM